MNHNFIDFSSKVCPYNDFKGVVIIFLVNWHKNFSGICSGFNEDIIVAKLEFVIVLFKDFFCSFSAIFELLLKFLSGTRGGIEDKEAKEFEVVLLFILLFKLLFLDDNDSSFNAIPLEDKERIIVG